MLKSSSNYTADLEQPWGGGATNDIPRPADYDGDDKADFAVWRPGNGYWYVLKSSTNYSTSLQWQLGSSAAGDVLVPGDYDGDGLVDPAVWRPTDGAWQGFFYVLKSSNGYNPSAGLTQQWGSGPAGYRPVVVDCDGDGKADFTVWRSTSGEWFVLKSSGGTLVVSWPVQ